MDNNYLNTPNSDNYYNPNQVTDMEDNIIYNDDNDNNNYKERKKININKKHLILGVLLILLLILIVFIITSCSKKGELDRLGIEKNNVDITNNDFLYTFVGNVEKYDLAPVGKGNLKKTEYSVTSLDSIVNASINKSTLELIGVSVGKTTLLITATLKDKKAEMQKEVLVCNKITESDIVSELSLELGSTTDLPINVYNEEDCYKIINITSSDESVVSVDGLKLKANQVGNAIIVIKSGSETVSINVEVKEKIVMVTGITVKPTSITMNKNETKKITATVKPSDATNKYLVWESSNTDVATVDKDGVVTSYEVGTATITVKATDGSNKSNKIKVTVKQPSSGSSNGSSNGSSGTTNSTKKTFTATFKVNTAKSIGASSLSCTTTETSCTITLPSITPADNKVVKGWATSKTSTTGSQPGVKYVLKENKTFYAITATKSSTSTTGVAPKLYYYKDGSLGKEVTQTQIESYTTATSYTFDLAFAKLSNTTYYYKYYVLRNNPGSINKSTESASACKKITYDSNNKHVFSKKAEIKKGDTIGFSVIVSVWSDSSCSKHVKNYYTDWIFAKSSTTKTTKEPELLDSEGNKYSTTSKKSIQVSKTKITIDAKFKSLDSNTYYYKWRTYASKTSTFSKTPHWDSDSCNKIQYNVLLNSLKKTAETLSFDDDNLKYRYGEWTVYSDKNCKNEVITYKTNVYYKKAESSNVSITFYDGSTVIGHTTIPKNTKTNVIMPSVGTGYAWAKDKKGQGTVYTGGKTYSLTTSKAINFYKSSIMKNVATFVDVKQQKYERSCYAWINGNADGDCTVTAPDIENGWAWNWSGEMWARNTNHKISTSITLNAREARTYTATFFDNNGKQLDKISCNAWLGQTCKITIQPNTNKITPWQYKNSNGKTETYVNGSTMTLSKSVNLYPAVSIG